MRGTRSFWRVAVLAACAALYLAGCDIIPTGGPLVKEVIDESRSARRYGFTLVDVDASVIDAMTAVPRHGLRDFFHDSGAVAPRIGPGDGLAITVFESGIDELFAPSAAQPMTYGTNRVTLPNATVDRAGDIVVPFAGIVHVAGLTPAAAGRAVARRLRGKGARPQILLSVATNASNVVTVTGAIKTPGRYALTPASETLLQLIAMAGGSTGLASDTILMLTRGDRQTAIRLSDLVRHPRDDLHALPGDYLDLSLNPRGVLIEGAVARPGAYSLAVDDTSLAQAIARAGGLRDAQADSRAVFLFRDEFPAVLRAVPADRIIAPAPPGTAAGDGLVPVIYKIDLKTASGIFYSARLRLRDKDLIFVPTAQTVDWQKYLDLFRMTTEPITTGATSGVSLNRAF
ncbi:MAG TPA: polysaccharide biosynthesis/export family protein [Stellaceae bacterium]